MLYTYVPNHTANPSSSRPKWMVLIILYCHSRGTHSPPHALAWSQRSHVSATTEQKKKNNNSHRCREQQTPCVRLAFTHRLPISHSEMCQQINSACATPKFYSAPSAPNHRPRKFRKIRLLAEYRNLFSTCFMPSISHHKFFRFFNSFEPTWYQHSNSKFSL